jgi:uncharacterized membrane protein
MNPYLRAFVIGSSVLVFLPYFIIVKSSVNKNYRYDDYTFLAPIGLGFFNVMSLILANYLNLTKKYRFLLISLLAPTLVAIFVNIIQAYDYTSTNQWFNHIWKLYLLYFIVFNYIVYYLDSNI